MSDDPEASVCGERGRFQCSMRALNIKNHAKSASEGHWQRTIDTGQGLITSDEQTTNPSSSLKSPAQLSIGKIHLMITSEEKTTNPPASLKSPTQLSIGKIHLMITSEEKTTNPPAS
ncbi:hypothetical protein KKD49_08315, partial [Myxococcota bacterium]|nr:hypothetical protein [Myxococcota bacterium]